MLKPASLRQETITWNSLIWIHDTNFTLATSKQKAPRSQGKAREVKPQVSEPSHSKAAWAKRGQSTWLAGRTPRVNDTLTATGGLCQAAKKDFTCNHRTFHTRSWKGWTLCPYEVSRSEQSKEIFYIAFSPKSIKTVGFPGGSAVRICLPIRTHKFNPWVRKISWRRKWQPTPVPLFVISHGRTKLVDYSSWGHKESDTT